MWFPLFVNGGGDFYAVVVSGDSNWGGIVGFLLGEQEHSIEYESLESMLLTMQICFGEGVYFISEEGYLEGDDNAQLIIAKRYNSMLESYSTID